jgi:hypothetical protein
MVDLGNIGPRGVRARAIQGGVALGAAIVLFVVQARRGTALGWTLPGTVLLWLAGIGILQARART